jgi:hypothetical protein
MQNANLHATQRQGIAFTDKSVERSSVARDIIGLEKISEYCLNIGDMLAYDNRRASPFTQIMRGGKMIRVRVRLKKVAQIKAIIANSLKQEVGTGGPRPPVAGREVEYRINYGRRLGGWIVHNVADRVGRGVKCCPHMRGRFARGKRIGHAMPPLFLY